MIAVPLLKHCVDVVGHSVLTLLNERQLVGVVIKCRKKFTVVWYDAALNAEPLLSVLQFAHQPMVVRELCRIAHTKSMAQMMAHVSVETMGMPASSAD